MRSIDPSRIYWNIKGDKIGFSRARVSLLLFFLSSYPYFFLSFQHTGTRHRQTIENVFQARANNVGCGNARSVLNNSPLVARACAKCVNKLPNRCVHMYMCLRRKKKKIIILANTCYRIWKKEKKKKRYAWLPQSWHYLSVRESSLWSVITTTTRESGIISRCTWFTRYAWVDLNQAGFRLIIHISRTRSRPNPWAGQLQNKAKNK